ncbi:hypothetical protein [Nostoc sp. 'Peltigera membranacea cyanobiont' 232]|uniref:hypothetical protein n=1 Tax=Nostoc sp. 'Peltigera membranacea cyanobiont' 232 TaxID=2014531 RepID=UPI00117C1A86|nr:hypothetical protein [Nostoc sp. 'Peltigera membranacea cyanobiont' 232]
MRRESIYRSDRFCPHLIRSDRVLRGNVVDRRSLPPLASPPRTPIVAPSSHLPTSIITVVIGKSRPTVARAFASPNQAFT